MRGGAAERAKSEISTSPNVSRLPKAGAHEMTFNTSSEIAAVDLAEQLLQLGELAMAGINSTADIVGGELNFDNLYPVLLQTFVVIVLG